MLAFEMRRSPLTEEQTGLFDALMASNLPGFRALVQSTLKFQSEILGFAPALRGAPQRREQAYADEDLMHAEVFTDGTALYPIVVERTTRRTFQWFRARPHGEEIVERESPYAWLTLYYIGPEFGSTGLRYLEAEVNRAFGVSLKPNYYRSRRFRELATEGTAHKLKPTENELQIARLLANRTMRELALAIKSTGGLLEKDLHRQLRDKDEDVAAAIRDRLLSADLIRSDLVVICKRTQTQVARVASREILEKSDALGVKCACGRPFTDESVEEFAYITENGRALLDASRWLTLLVVDELRRIGAPEGKIIIEHQMGGDELDCLAEVGGELVFFELKDKEFNIGNAYSFGAKIGIAKPVYPVILSTVGVGGDAKEHFQRAGLSGDSGDRQSDDYEADFRVIGASSQRAPVRYIEGLDQMRVEVEKLATEIYTQEAIRVLKRALQVASVDPFELVGAVAARVQEGAAMGLATTEERPFAPEAN